MTARAAPVTELRARILDAAQVLVLERGFAATTVDAVLEATGASKGAFFHHFPTKAALADALVERYARADAAILGEYLAAAEARSSDPAVQLVEFLRLFEHSLDRLAQAQPGCLFASFVYDQLPDGSGVGALILESIQLWRSRILAKLEQAARSRVLAAPVDLSSLADQVFTVFEGGFVLARATRDPTRLRAQLGHLRTYYALLLGVDDTTGAPLAGVSPAGR